MGNLVTRSAPLVPQASVDVAYPSIWYACHEGAGTTLADALGDGPSLTAAGTTSGIWEAAGCLTPNGSDVVAPAGVNAHAQSIFRLDTLRSGAEHLLLGFEVQYVSASASAAAVLWFGRSAVTVGGWGIEINGSDQPNVNIRPADAAGSVTSSTYGRSIGDTHAAMVSVVIDVTFDGNMLVSNLLDSVNEAVGQATIDTASMAMPTGASDGLTLFARRTAASTFDRFLGAGANGARINNIWAQRRPSYDASLLAYAYADMRSNRREFPRHLRG